MADAQEAIDELLATHPPVHLAEGDAQDWGLGQDALAWLAESYRTGAPLKPAAVTAQSFSH